MSKVDIFEFDDYRKFLRATYRALKETRASYSFRYFARRGGFSSPNFFKLVMDGDRNLSADGIQKFNKALNLNRQESEFFENLVFFNQAKSAEDKTKFFERMTRSLKFRSARALSKESFQYYSKWYYTAIRELVGLSFFQEDPAWIARSLLPPITEPQAKKGLALLLKLGLLKRDESGRLQQSEPVVSTAGPEVQSLSVVRHHQEMAKMASRAVESIPWAERDISSVTLSVSAAEISELKEEITRFRQKLLAAEGGSKHSADRIYQLNIQLFPLTQTKEDKS